MRTLVYNSTCVCNKTMVIQNESTDSCKHIYSLTIILIDKAEVAFPQVCPLRESNKLTIIECCFLLSSAFSFQNNYNTYR